MGLFSNMDMPDKLDFATSAFDRIYNVFSNERARNDARRAQNRAYAREDSAVQRRAADLTAAGLNPLLAVGNPASSMAPIRIPGESNTQVVPFTEIRKRHYENELTRSSIENTRAQNMLIQAQAAKTAAEKSEVEERTKLLREQATTAGTQADYNRTLTRYTDKNIQKMIYDTAKAQSEIKKTSLENELLDIRSRAEARDLQLLEDIGLMQKPPSGVTGQVGQIVSVMLNKVQEAVLGLKDMTSVTRPQNVPTGGRGR